VGKSDGTANGVMSGASCLSLLQKASLVGGPRSTCTDLSRSQLHHAAALTCQHAVWELPCTRWSWRFYHNFEPSPLLSALPPNIVVILLARVL
jgi:hypothetical protein